MAEPEAESLLSVAQAAGLLGVHPNTIRTWTDAGRLTAYRINARGDRRFRRSDVVRLLVEDGTGADDAGPSHAPTPGSHGDLAVFTRIAAGLATTPTIGSVARTLVEALRTELHADRAAVYAVGDGRLQLAAHAGFDVPPPLVHETDAEA
jgi:excisionase family DNA binding protein